MVHVISKTVYFFLALVALSQVLAAPVDEPRPDTLDPTDAADLARRSLNPATSIRRANAVASAHNGGSGHSARHVDTGNIARRTAAPLPTGGTTPQSPSAADRLIKEKSLAGHNNFRTSHGASPLAWNEDLAGVAGLLTSRCSFQHFGGTPYGENLGSGTGDYTVTDVIHEWRAEAKDYDPKHLAYSRFTQAVVWKSTKGVGCATADCPSSRKFVVCEYSPRGNVRGEFSQNVRV